MQKNINLSLIADIPFSLPNVNESTLSTFTENWNFNLDDAKRLVQEDSPEFCAMAQLACQNIEDIPQKTAFFSLDYQLSEEPPTVIEASDVVGIYAHPFVTSQHLFTPRYAQITLSDQINKAYTPQEVAVLNFPRLLSIRQIKWFEKMGMSSEEGLQSLSLDAYLFLKQNGYINDIFLSNNLTKFSNPFIGGIANLFDIPEFEANTIALDEVDEDDPLQSSQARVIHHYKNEIFAGLLEYLTSSALVQDSRSSKTNTHGLLMQIERDANLNLLSRIEQFRAYACLQAASQNIHTIHEPIGVYRGVMQMRGLQPYFYLSMDKTGFIIAERLLAMGYTLHPRLMPAFEKTLASLHADNKIPQYVSHSAGYASGVLSDIASTSHAIVAELLSNFTTSKSNKD